MNILFGFVALGILLLAVDLLTAPKHTTTSPKPRLKDSRHTA